MATQYDKIPTVKISNADADCRYGSKAITDELLAPSHRARQA